MEQYISKSALVAEIEKEWRNLANKNAKANGKYDIAIYTLLSIKSFIDTLEVKDPYEQIVQYDSIKAGIQAHAETYSFNIESKLFNQLTEEQQKLWRKEIEEACISGSEVGVELARDTRYKENLEVKEVDLEKETDKWYNTKASKEFENVFYGDIEECAKYFFELGLKSERRITMTPEEKFSKAVKLADAMYYAAQMLSTDASHLRKAMKDWWNFKNFELNNKE